MSQIDGGKCLTDVVMPGSHDAAMYETIEWLGAKESEYVITQFETIKRQLDFGTRFFDIRIYVTERGELRVGHFQNKQSTTVLGGLMRMGGFGPSFVDVMGQFKAFLKEQPTETVLIKFSLADDVKKFKHFIEFDEILGDFPLYTEVGRNLADVRLDHLRGRLLPLFDPKEQQVLSRRGFHLVDKDPPLAGGNIEMRRSILWINGNAPMQGDIQSVMKKQHEARKKAEARGKMVPHLEMFYLTITATISNFYKGLSVVDNTAREFKLTGSPQPRSNTRSKFAGWQNNCAPEYKRHMDTVGRPAPNIWQYDFINVPMNELILSKNSGLK